MAGLVRMSEASVLALHALAYLAQDPGRRLSAKQIATGLDISEAHLAKVLQRLERHGLVSGKRGPQGGFLLGTDAMRISLQDIYEAIEGPDPKGVCLLGRPACIRSCLLHQLVCQARKDLTEKLKHTTLSAFAARSGMTALS